MQSVQYNVFTTSHQPKAAFTSELMYVVMLHLLLQWPWALQPLICTVHCFESVVMRFKCNVQCAMDDGVITDKSVFFAMHWYSQHTVQCKKVQNVLFWVCGKKYYIVVYCIPLQYTLFRVQTLCIVLSVWWGGYQWSIALQSPVYNIKLLQNALQLNELYCFECVVRGSFAMQRPMYKIEMYCLR